EEAAAAAGSPSPAPGGASEPGGKRLFPKSSLRSTRKASPLQKKFVLIPIGAIGAFLLIGSGWYFGVKIPAEKKRLAIAAAEEARVKAENELKRKQEEARLAKLAAARGTLMIDTDPAGATITFEDGMSKKAPVRIKDLHIGKLPLKINLD